MTKSLIRFDSSSHWYSPEGKAKHDADLRIARKTRLYPSVTSILKDQVKNVFLDSWKMNQLVLAAGASMRQPHENEKEYAQRIYDMSMEKARDAAEFGKKIHDACEKYPTPPSEAGILPWFQKFETWYRSTILEPIQRESVLLDHDLGVAGRTDLIAKLLNGRRAVIDYKSQDVKVSPKGKKIPAYYDDFPKQLSFYAVCDAKACGMFPELPECMSVIIDSNEGGEVYTKTYEKDEILAAYEDFVLHCYLWFKGRGYWPHDKPFKVGSNLPMPI